MAVGIALVVFGVVAVICFEVIIGCVVKIVCDMEVIC